MNGHCSCVIPGTGADTGQGDPACPQHGAEVQAADIAEFFAARAARVGAERLREFVRESNRIEGIHRTTAAQVEAHRRFLSTPTTVESLMTLVGVLQPDARLRDHPDVPGVRVGNHVAPPSGLHIRAQLEELLASGGDLWVQHVAYETLHPFTDGNGRSGRALWLHRMGRAPLGFLHHFYYQALERSR